MKNLSSPSRYKLEGIKSDVSDGSLSSHGGGGSKAESSPSPGAHDWRECNGKVCTCLLVPQKCGEALCPRAKRCPTITEAPSKPLPPFEACISTILLVCLSCYDVCLSSTSFSSVSLSLLSCCPSRLFCCLSSFPSCQLPPCNPFPPNVLLQGSEMDPKEKGDLGFACISCWRRNGVKGEGWHREDKGTYRHRPHSSHQKWSKMVSQCKSCGDGHEHENIERQTWCGWVGRKEGGWMDR